MTKRKPPADLPRVEHVPGQLDLDGQPALPPSMRSVPGFDASPDHPGPRGRERITAFAPREADPAVLGRILTKLLLGGGGAVHRQRAYLTRIPGGTRLVVDAAFADLSAAEVRAVEALAPGIHRLEQA